jgi:hypothetical protein
LLSNLGFQVSRRRGAEGRAQTAPRRHVPLPEPHFTRPPVGHRARYLRARTADAGIISRRFSGLWWCRAPWRRSARSRLGRPERPGPRSSAAALGCAPATPPAWCRPEPRRVKARRASWPNHCHISHFRPDILWADCLSAHPAARWYKTCAAAFEITPRSAQAPGMPSANRPASLAVPDGPRRAPGPQAQPSAGSKARSQIPARPPPQTALPRIRACPACVADHVCRFSP